MRICARQGEEREERGGREGGREARAREAINLKGTRSTQGRVVPHGSQFPWWSRSLVAAGDAQRVAKSHSRD